MFLFLFFLYTLVQKLKRASPSYIHTHPPPITNSHIYSLEPKYILTTMMVLTNLLNARTLKKKKNDRNPNFNKESNFCKPPSAHRREKFK